METGKIDGWRAWSTLATAHLGIGGHSLRLRHLQWRAAVYGAPRTASWLRLQLNICHCLTLCHQPVLYLRTSTSPSSFASYHHVLSFRGSAHPFPCPAGHPYDFHPSINFISKLYKNFCTFWLVQVKKLKVKKVDFDSSCKLTVSEKGAKAMKSHEKLLKVRRLL